MKVAFSTVLVAELLAEVDAEACEVLDDELADVDAEVELELEGGEVVEAEEDVTDGPGQHRMGVVVELFAPELCVSATATTASATTAPTAATGVLPI